mmetsp:Transcript_31333/g.57445  ORF Transcript_31333/g.57445 Transcript_31333/m.57445 type:complete len:272 (+) Transcript_31333:37-852(+)
MQPTCHTRDRNRHSLHLCMHLLCAAHAQLKCKRGIGNVHRKMGDRRLKRREENGMRLSRFHEEFAMQGTRAMAKSSRSDGSNDSMGCDCRESLPKIGMQVSSHMHNQAPHEYAIQSYPKAASSKQNGAQMPCSLPRKCSLHLWQPEHQARVHQRIFLETQLPVPLLQPVIKWSHRQSSSCFLCACHQPLEQCQTRGEAFPTRRLLGNGWIGRKKVKMQCFPLFTTIQEQVQVLPLPDNSNCSYVSQGCRCTSWEARCENCQSTPELCRQKL